MNSNESLQMTSADLRFIVNGREYPLNAGTLRIGRAADNDVVIDDESVSSHHALISCNSGIVMVTDLQSKNGTFINGQRVLVAPLAESASLSLGSVQCSFAGSQSCAGDRPNDDEDKPASKVANTSSAPGVPFTIVPRSDRGKSVIVAFVVMTFFNWFYMPLGMFVILALGLGILTGIRYLRWRFTLLKAPVPGRGSQAQVPWVELPETKPLWKRSPFITGAVCLVFMIFSNWESSSSSAHLMAEYAEQFSRIQRESEGLNSFGSAVMRGIEGFAYGSAGDISRGFELDREVNEKNQNLEAQAARLSLMHRLSSETKQASDRAANLGIICLLGLVGFLIYDHRKRARSIQH